MPQTKTMIQIIEPSDIDAHFKYICKDESCLLEHWVSLKEARTKNFKIVCDCGSVYHTKRVTKLAVVYKRKSTNKDLCPEVLNKCVTALKTYGFDEKESENLIKRAFESTKNTDIGLLIKLSLKLFGESQNG